MARLAMHLQVDARDVVEALSRIQFPSLVVTNYMTKPPIVGLFHFDILDGGSKFFSSLPARQGRKGGWRAWVWLKS